MSGWIAFAWLAGMCLILMWSNDWKHPLSGEPWWAMLALVVWPIGVPALFVAAQIKRRVMRKRTPAPRTRVTPDPYRKDQP